MGNNITCVLKKFKMCKWSWLSRMCFFCMWWSHRLESYATCILVLNVRKCLIFHLDLYAYFTPKAPIHYIYRDYLPKYHLKIDFEQLLWAFISLFHFFISLCYWIFKEMYTKIRFKDIYLNHNIFRKISGALLPNILNICKKTLLKLIFVHHLLKIQ